MRYLQGSVQAPQSRPSSGGSQVPVGLTLLALIGLVVLLGAGYTLMQVEERRELERAPVTSQIVEGGRQESPRLSEVSPMATTIEERASPGPWSGDQAGRDLESSRSDLALHLSHLRTKLEKMSEVSKRAQDLVRAVAEHLDRDYLQEQHRRLQSADHYIEQVRREIEESLEEVDLAQSHTTTHEGGDR